MKEYCSFGVAGNFTGHLEQAGEAIDFKNVKTLEANAPKAIFPTYISSEKSICPDYLKVFPFDQNKVIFPKNEEKIQIEPECGIIFKAKWQDEVLVELTPLAFGASNDCSIRKQGANKISEKKNWGPSSKGFSSKLIPIDTFDSNGLINKYRIASFIKRNNTVYAYGEDSAVREYSYIYQKLMNWMLDKFNNQKCEGPAEDIHSYLLTAGKPEKIMVSIGATRYTKFGETNFLQDKDKTFVVLYPETYSPSEILKKVEKEDFDFSEKSDISALIQTVVLNK